MLVSWHFNHSYNYRCKKITLIPVNINSVLCIYHYVGKNWYLLSKMQATQSSQLAGLILLWSACDLNQVELNYFRSELFLKWYVQIFFPSHLHQQLWYYQHQYISFHFCCLSIYRSWLLNELRNPQFRVCNHQMFQNQNHRKSLMHHKQYVYNNSLSKRW